jgi:hypothetical protein
LVAAGSVAAARVWRGEGVAARAYIAGRALVGGGKGMARAGGPEAGAAAVARTGGWAAAVRVAGSVGRAQWRWARWRQG